jgi:hypothetical protein
MLNGMYIWSMTILERYLHLQMFQILLQFGTRASTGGRIAGNKLASFLDQCDDGRMTPIVIMLLNIKGHVI